LAQQRLLQTTSNNIVNVNSQGYVRERTLISTNSVGLGTGDMVSERIINAYAQAEVRRDTSAYNAANTADQLFRSTACSVMPATAWGPPSPPISRLSTPPTSHRPRSGAQDDPASELSGMVDSSTSPPSSTSSPIPSTPP
jgi:flagellar hook-associated protein 1 FlgK